MDLHAIVLATIFCQVIVDPHSPRSSSFEIIKKKLKLNGFRVGYGHPWIIYSSKIRVWILTSIDNRVSMSKLFGSGMGILDPYLTHGHP